MQLKAMMAGDLYRVPAEGGAVLSDLTSGRYYCTCTRANPQQKGSVADTCILA